MTSRRYSQNCPVARAAEIIGERWTLLIMRELFLGPQRFSDLKDRLSGVSSSVLTTRLDGLEALDVIRRRNLPPPAASRVYELTENGRALEPALHALVRWGTRFLSKPRPGDKFEPEWLRLALLAYARKSASPPRAYEIRIQAEGKEVSFNVLGGRKGTTITDSPVAADVKISASPGDLLGLVSGSITPTDALRAGKLRAEGDLEALEVLPELFEMKQERSRSEPSLVGAPSQQGD